MLRNMSYKNEMKKISEIYDLQKRYNWTEVCKKSKRIKFYFYNILYHLQEFNVAKFSHTAFLQFSAHKNQFS